MYLRFNEGAIVRFTLIGCDNPVSIVGKVVEVFPDEVEVCPQIEVFLNGNLDKSLTADSDTTIHIRRKLIQSWTYAKFSDIDVPGVSYIYDDNRHTLPVYHTTTKLFSDHIFNKFKDGFCKGTGRYCGHIEAGNHLTGEVLV